MRQFAPFCATIFVLWILTLALNNLTSPSPPLFNPNPSCIPQHFTETLQLRFFFALSSHHSFPLILSVTGWVPFTSKVLPKWTCELCATPLPWRKPVFSTQIRQNSVYAELQDRFGCAAPAHIHRNTLIYSHLLIYFYKAAAAAGSTACCKCRREWMPLFVHAHVCVCVCVG